MVTTTTQASGIPDALGTQVDEHARSVHDALGRMADATAAATRRVSDDGQRLGRRLINAQDVWMDEAVACVRRHPVASVAVAAGIGLLLSRILR